MSSDDPRPDAPVPPPPASRAPVVNAPLVVVVLCALIVLAHLAREGLFGSAQAADELALWLAVIRTGPIADEIPPAPLFGLTPYVLHVFVHFGWLHLLMNLGVMLAVGSQTARAFGSDVRGTVGFLVFFFACAIGGALLVMVTGFGESSLVAGASSSISGLIASAGWARGGRSGMLRLALPWLGLDLVLAVTQQFFSLPISWEGHIGGLIVGMVAFPLFLAIFRTPPDGPRSHRPF